MTIFVFCILLLFLGLYFWVVVSCSVLEICKLTKVKIDFKIILVL